MATTAAVNLQPGESYRFKDVHFSSQFLNVLRIERGSEALALIEDAQGAIPSPGTSGPAGNVNDDDFTTFVEAPAGSSVAFPEVYVGKQNRVKQITVTWQSAFVPKEYVIEARDTLVESWILAQGRAFGEFLDSAHSFDMDHSHNWFRVRVTRGNPNFAMRLSDIRFYGISGPSQARRVLAAAHLFRVSEGDSGETVVTNNSEDPQEIQLQTM